jgi:hypothetical protein
METREGHDNFSLLGGPLHRLGRRLGPEEFAKQFAAAMSTKGLKLIEVRIVQSLKPVLRRHL